MRTTLGMIATTVMLTTTGCIASMPNQAMLGAKLTDDEVPREKARPMELPSVRASKEAGRPPPSEEVLPKAGDPPSKRLRCERMVDGAQTFMGQQAGFGIATGMAAVGAGALGIAVSNDSSGGFWEENRKTVFLAATAALVPIAINFFSNAISAGKSASKATTALSHADEDKMYSDCLAARASYYDDRVAAVEEAKAEFEKKANKLLEEKLDAVQKEASAAKAAAANAETDARSANATAAAVEQKVNTANDGIEQLLMKAGLPKPTGAPPPPKPAGAAPPPKPAGAPPPPKPAGAPPQ